MLEFSLSERNRIADNLFGGENFTIKAFSGVIAADGTGGTEITAAGYAAIAVTNNTATFPNASNGTRANAVKLPSTFLEITADFTVLSLGFFKTSDNTFLARKVFDVPFEVYNGQSFGFQIGAITFTPTNP